MDQLIIRGPGIPLNYLSTDTTFAADSDQKVPTEKAIKAQIATQVVAGGGAWGVITGKPEITLGDTVVLTHPMAEILYGDGSEDDEPYFTELLAAISTTEVTLVIPKGTYKIGSHLTFPSNIHIVFRKGAILAPDTLSGTGTNISNADADLGAATITTTLGSNSATVSSATGLLRGMYCTTEGSQRLRIKDISSLTLTLWQNATATETGVQLGKSTPTITGTDTAFDTELEAFDIIYIGGVKYIVTAVTSATAINVHKYPTATFSGQAFAYGVRVKIQGSIEAGRYQIFSGNGVVKFGSTTFGDAGYSAVYPEWWGAKAKGNIADAATNSLAFLKTVFSGTGKPQNIDLAWGRYFISEPMMWPVGTWLVGKGGNRGTTGTTISGNYYTGTAFNLLEEVPEFTGATYNGEIKDIFFQAGAYNNADGVPVYCLYFNGSSFSGGNIGNRRVMNCAFYNFTDYAIWQGFSGTTVVNNCRIFGNYGVKSGGDCTIQCCEFAVGTTGIGIYATGLTLIVGNFMYGDSGVSNTGIFSVSTDTVVNGNHIFRFIKGIQLGSPYGGLVTGNIIGSCTSGIYATAYFRESFVTNNRIYSCTTGVNLDNCQLHRNGVITHNEFYNNTTDISAFDWGYLWGGLQVGLIENNYGIDLQGNIPNLTVNSATPSVQIGKRWRTANTSATPISNFRHAAKGKEIIISVEDENTTIARWGGSFDYIYTYDASPETFSANLKTTTAWTYFPDAEVGDIIYWENGTTGFSGIKLQVGTSFAASSQTFTWEYWNGTAWTELTVANGDSFASAPGSYDVTFMPPRDWVITTINGVPCFFVRCRLSAVDTPTANGANVDVINIPNNIRLNGSDFGPLSAGQIGQIHLIHDGCWRELSRTIN